MPDAQQIMIETSDGSMPARLWQPAAPTGPGLVLVQEIFGVSAYIQARAADLAALGYVVCAPELYWRLGEDAMQAARRDDLEEAMGIFGRVDWELGVADVVTTLEHLRGRLEVAGGVGFVGFCFGGGLAFNAAAVEPPDVLVSYYGSALPELLDLTELVQVPSLHHFGLADTFIPPEVVQQISTRLTAGENVRFETYPGAGHAFDNPNPDFHHPEASRDAWGVTTRFLAEHLPLGAG
jgi:carboxymethylenebutenolidase